MAADPAYERLVLPMLDSLLGARPSGRYLDLGCGEGRAMRLLAGGGALVVGCDLSAALLARAAPAGPVVRGRLPDLGWVRAGSFDGAYAVLVLEHLADAARFFAEVARAVRVGGVLVVVSNHPVFTAPGSGPVVDAADGEVFWRFGPYLAGGVASVEPAGPGTTTFHHRPLGELLTTARSAGWVLERAMEAGPDAGTVDALLARQLHIPRLLGVRWERMG